jgi:signal transduction histidine kinase
MLARQIGHDFNNFLESIIGYATQLKTKLPPGEKLHHYAEMIELAGNEAGAAAERLLTFGRSWTVNPSMIPVSIEAIQEEIARVVEMGDGGAPAQVSIERATARGRMAVDLRQMQSAVGAVRANACEAYPEGQTPGLALQFSVDGGDALPREPVARSNSGKWLHVALSDQGKGMDEETLRQAVEPGFTTHAGARRQGLGLPTAIGFAHAHAGVFDIRSEPDRGTTVLFWLPIHEWGA